MIIQTSEVGVVLDPTFLFLRQRSVVKGKQIQTEIFALPG